MSKTLIHKLLRESLLETDGEVRAEIGSKGAGYFLVHLKSKDNYKVGELTLEYTEPRHRDSYKGFDDKYFEYSRIIDGEISPSHRGEGFYIKMIQKAIEYTKSLGLTGIHSCKYCMDEDRSDMADRSWYLMYKDQSRLGVTIDREEDDYYAY